VQRAKVWRGSVHQHGIDAAGEMRLARWIKMAEF
jgi:hypothetical protein